jgi:hypothetical protein
VSRDSLISKPSKVDSLLGALVVMGAIVMQGVPPVGFAITAFAVTMLALRAIQYRSDRAERRPPSRDE